MSANPLVSVIVLAYNAEHTLDATMKRLVEQRCNFDYEIVLGEDCSTDNTRAIARRWAEDYPDLVRLMPDAPNKGLVDNYFDCLEACRGEYVTDCSAGDLFTSETRIQNMTDFLLNNKGCVAVYTDAHSASGKFRFKGELRVADYLGASGRGSVIMSAIMYRKQVIDRALKMSGQVVRNRAYGCEDVPVVCALAASGEIGYLADEDSFLYDDSMGSVSRATDADKLMAFHFATFMCICDMAEHYKVWTVPVKRRLAEKLNYLGSLVLRHGDKVWKEKWRAAYTRGKRLHSMKCFLRNLLIVWSKVSRYKGGE